MIEKYYGCMLKKKPYEVIKFDNYGELELHGKSNEKQKFNYIGFFAHYMLIVMAVMGILSLIVRFFE
jgi:hypothetical protein